MSIDEDGSRRRSVFTTDSASVVCVAQVGIGRKDVTLDIRIRQIRDVDPTTDSVTDVSRVIAAVEHHPGITQSVPSLLTLAMKPTSVQPDGTLKEDDKAPFPSGSFRCEILLDGELEAEIPFNIDFAGCPPTVIPPNAKCLGFQRLNAACPQSGESGSPEPTCTCTAEGWSCPQ